MTVREKQCIKCGEFKPSTEFKRKLTIAQSRAVLRNPKINKPYIADSKRCKACQSELKRHTPLSIKEIKTKISTGDIHPVIGQFKVEQMERAIPKMRSRVMKLTWQKRKAKPLKQLQTNLAQQVAKYANRYHAMKAHNPQHAELAQYKYSYEEAKRVRNDLMDRAKRGEKIDPTTRIEPLIKPKQYQPQGESQ